MGKRNTDLDLGAGMGWCVDYPFDPGSVLRALLNPNSLQSGSSTRYDRKLRAALRLKGPARDRALGKIDLEVTKELAPAVVLNVYNNRYFFSSRVDRRSLVYSNPNTDWSIPALALK
jgi:hypothetical protein